MNINSNTNITGDLIKEEDDVIEKFVKETPYPNYEEMVEKLDDHIDLWSEYSEQNHICCKMIYENPRNKKLIIEMGKKIYVMGGMQALTANHTVIKYFSPYWKSSNIIIKSQGRLLEDYFQEVCDEWIA